MLINLHPKIVTRLTDRVINIIMKHGVAVGNQWAKDRLPTEWFLAVSKEILKRNGKRA